MPNDLKLAEYDGVVIVTIRSGVRQDQPGWNTWTLSARKTKVVAGVNSRRVYKFTTTQGSDGCGKTPLPPKGQKWVIYYRQGEPERVANAYPLSLVREHDPRLANVC